MWHKLYASPDADPCFAASAIELLHTTARYLILAVAGLAATALMMRWFSAAADADLVVNAWAIGAGAVISGALGWAAAQALYMIGNAFFVFMLRQFFMTLPEELSEAARIEGIALTGLKG